MKQLVLVDAKNLLYRVHYAHRSLCTTDGKPTSVLFGMLSSLLTMAKRLPEAQWAFVWDGYGRTWRHDLLDETSEPPLMLETERQCETKSTLETNTRFESKLRARNKNHVREERQDWFQQQLKNANSFLTGTLRPPGQTTRPSIAEPHREAQTVKKAGIRVRPKGYKANRELTDGNDDRLVALAQVEEIKLALKNLGFRQFEVPYLEGDDLMGILVTQLRECFDQVIIQSGDRDFYQFIDGMAVRQLKRIFEGKLVWADKKEIELEFGIQLEDWVKLKALIGDSTDNIPHLFDGVGEKTAAKWLQQGLDPSLESFESHEISVQKEFAKLLVRKNIVDLENRWWEVHRNFRLCKIITSWRALEVKSCRTEIRKQCDGLTVESLARKPMKDWYRWLSSWLVKWEMSELYGDRDAFGRIP